MYHCFEELLNDFSKWLHNFKFLPASYEDSNYSKSPLTIVTVFFIIIILVYMN